jgi:hypothetical protein
MHYEGMLPRIRLASFDKTGSAMIVALDCRSAAAWLNPSGERSPPLSAFESRPAKSIRAVDQGLFPVGKFAWLRGQER